jgi:hypothetical protein
LVLVVTLLLSPTAGMAQDAQRIKNALNNVNQEMMECAAYYYISAACFAVSNRDAKTIEQMKQISDDFLERGIRVANEIGLTADAQLSRFKMANQEQMKLLNGSCVNFSSLMSRYLDRCERVYNDFRAVVNEYMK